MKTANWFKIVWWLLLLGLTTTFLILRFNKIINGQSIPFDIFVFLIWTALMLFPIYSKVELFGIKLHREIEQMKKDINEKLIDLKTDIRLNQNQSFTANIGGYGPLPPDDKIPDLELQIEKIIGKKLEKYRIHENFDIKGRLDIPENNLLLFKVRYNIEQQVNRIWTNRFPLEYNIEFRKSIPIWKQIQELDKYEIINGNLYGILREVLSICNYGVHGEKISDNQIEFVLNSAKEIIDYLSEIK
jgi:hypothetical protein